MKTINIYGNNKYEKSTKYREACRGIVLKEDKLLLTYEANTDQWFIHGGGLENGETNSCFDYGSRVLQKTRL